MRITNVIGATTKLEFANFQKSMPAQGIVAGIEHVPVNGNIHTDSITISPDAAYLLAAKEEYEKTDNIAELLDMLKRLNEQSTETDSPFDDFAKCVQIALRIINGDRVPIKDQQFLAETEPEMYANAIMLQRQNDDPEKFSSLLEDEKDDTTTNEGSPSVKIEFNAQPIESLPVSNTPNSSEAIE